MIKLGNEATVLTQSFFGIRKASPEINQDHNTVFIKIVPRMTISLDQMTSENFLKKQTE